tara:strand:- start:291 stop:965 length:675 start_codon:yes stop_codon:yes gene_type:complete
MTNPHNTKNVIEALSLFQSEANAAVKSNKNPFFKSTYASLEDVIAAANEGAKYGLAFTQVLDFEKPEGSDPIMYLKTSLLHKASDTAITSRYLVVPKNSRYDDSQALGSAITYAKRYSLQAIYGLPSEDDDGNANTHNDKVNADQKRKMTVWVNSIKQSVKATMDNPEMTKAEKIHDLFMLKKENAGSFDKLLQLDKGQWDMLMQHIIKQEKILGGNDEQSNAD